MSRRLVIFVALALLGSSAVKAQGVRSEAPIREVILSDGVRRYAVPIKVGGASIDAGLDTGSSGLRVLPSVLQPDDAKQSGGGDTYAYGSGAQLDGVVARGLITVGALSAPSTFQMVRHIGCTSRKPDCPAAHVPPAQYGVQGDGLPGEGFKAILGVNMAEAEVATPLRAIGAKRWIVELPRPGESGPGKLILNPSDEEVQGYTMVPIQETYQRQQGGLHDAIAGCLVNNSTNQKACGAVMLDCGAPGIQVLNTPLSRQPWARNTPALLVFYDAQNNPRAVESLSIGLPEHASHLQIGEGPQRGPVIFSGLTAYFAFSVLYEPDRGLIGLKPREPAPGGPKGQLVAP